VVGAIAARVSANSEKTSSSDRNHGGKYQLSTGIFTASDGVGGQWALKPFNIYIFVWVDRGCISEEKTCSSFPYQVSIDEQDQGV
jgi:hypothetical protein